MKVQLQIKQLFALPCLVVCILLGAAPSESRASRVEAGVDYPSTLGTMAQNFSSNFGGTAAIYIEPLLDPQIRNFLSVSYASFTVLADQKTAYRIVPVLVGIELPGKVFNDLQVTAAFGVGGAFAYLNIANAASIRGYGFFAAQIKPGLLWDISPDFSLYARMPVTFLIAQKQLNYLAYSVGAQLKL